jgi:signal transduction histidine kinase
VTRRLVLSYVGLAVLLLLFLEIPLAVLAARHERDLTVAQTERLATGLAIVAAGDMEPGGGGNLASTVTQYQVETGGVVEVVNTGNQLVARSDQRADPDVLVDQSKLIQAALSGRSMTAYGDDDARPWAHAAVPIVTDQGQTAGVVMLGVPAVSTENRIHDIWLALVGFGVGLIALTALVGVLLARSLARPLGRLGDTVAHFAGGHLDVRARSDDGPPEIRSLAGQFNDMARRMTDLLEAQSRFVADASHQLRSPLTALRLRLENLEADSVGASADGIAAAGREVQRLSRIVDGLLTLSRTGGEGPRRAAVDIGEVIEERCAAWSALADERHLALLSETGKAPATVSWVQGDLDQILDNLLANAVDASPDRTSIRVALCRDESGSLELHVIDNGPGMTAADRSRAFDRFWQGPGTGDGHSGLGLAIVRQLAARNAATVELRQADPSGIDAVVAFGPSAEVQGHRTARIRRLSAKG